MQSGDILTAKAAKDTCGNHPQHSISGGFNYFMVYLAAAP